MKKVISIILLAAVLLALTTCGETPTAPAAAPAPTATSAPVPTPTPTSEPETTPATSIVLRAPAVVAELNRGDTVELCGEPYGITGYYIVRTAGAIGLVEKQLVRPKSELAPAEWTGYANYNAKFCVDRFLKVGEAVYLNTEIKVIDEFDNCYFVETDGRKGFIAKDAVSEYYIEVYYGGGGGGGGGSADGGDISLAYRTDTEAKLTLLGYEAPQEAKTTGKGTVKLDGTPVIAAFYDYGEELRVIKQGDSFTEVYIRGIAAKVDNRMLRMEGKPEYEPWTGYASAYDAGLYYDFELSKCAENIAMNTELQVIQAIDDILVIKYNDSLYYMDAAQVSAEITVVYSGGYDGGGGSGGGGEWTEPVL